MSHPVPDPFAGRNRILPAVRLLLTSAVIAACASWVQADIRVEAYIGEPLGVGRVEFDLPHNAPQFVPGDQRYGIDDAADRVLYPAVEQPRARKVLRNLLRIDLPRKVTYYFLFQGSEPLELDLYLPDRTPVTVVPREDRRAYDELLGEWWEQYVELYQRVHDQAAYPIGVQTYLTAMWAARLGQEMPRLEGQLVRDQQAGGTVTGKLLADEAYRAAVLHDLMLGASETQEASEPLPEPQVPVAALPPPTEEVEVEPMATHVPEECFYVRFGTFENYLWFRQLTERWQGDLGNMLVLRSIRRSAGERITQQLALKQSRLSEVLGPQVIDDVAIIGMDPYVRDGAAIGVLFHAKNSFLLSTNFNQQRAAAADEVEGATLESVDIAGHEVSLLSSPDGTLRSYYATRGQFHFVASSRAMVERFFAAGEGERALAAAPDFLAARQTFPIAREETALVHLSQAFLQHLTSPAYRIELDRRLRSIEAGRALQLARLAARQEGVPGDTVDDLVAGVFLPEDFTARADGAAWETDEAGERYESVRGYPGRMLPIADNLPRQCTPAERQRYERFAADVIAEAGSLVPLTVSVVRQPLAADRERLLVDVRLERYASTNLAAWAKKLGPPSPARVAPITGDLISAEVVLDGLLGGGKPFHLFGGLRDGPLPLEVRDGQLSSAASLLHAVEGYVGAWPRPQFLQRMLGPPREPYDADGLARTRGLFDLWCRRADDFLLFSFKRHVLMQVGSQLAMVDAARPAQAWVAVQDLAGSQYEQTASALGYARARQTSASGSRFMNSLVEQLHVDRQSADQLAGELVSGEFVCPLGGEYMVVEVPGGIQAWASTAAAPNNQFLLTEVPADYRFPLLEWFRGMTAEVRRGDDWLHLAATVDMSPARPADSENDVPPPPDDAEELPPPPPADSQ